MEQKKVMFTNKQLVTLILPLAMEQLLSILVGMIDQIMVSNSKAGTAAMSGVSLVNTIAILLVMVFSALASGGSVVTAQYIGKGDLKTANNTAKQLLLLTAAVSVTISGFSLIANRSLLKLIYGGVGEEIMNNAVIYFRITAYSFPALAIYNAGTAILRAQRNSKVSLATSIIMNITNIAGNAIFIYLFDRGVDGVAYSTLISRVVAMIVVLYVLSEKKFQVHIDNYLTIRPDGKLMKKICQIGIPSGIENSIFQVGKLLTQSLVASCGDAAVTANAVCATVEPFVSVPSSAIGLGMMTVVGQCIGANEKEQAKKNSSKLIKVAYVFLIAVNAVMFFCAEPVCELFNVHPGDAAYTATITILHIHNVACSLVWPLAFTIPTVLRAAGDVKYPMMVSICSMWLCRIGIAYIFVKALNLGVIGVWCAMYIDWFVRAVFHVLRYKKGAWLNKGVVNK